MPLSSRRASGVLGNTFKKMGLRAEQIDHSTYSQCPVPDPRNFHKADSLHNVLPATGLRSTRRRRFLLTSVLHMHVA